MTRSNIMNGLKISLLAFLVTVIFAVAPYFITMLTSGQTNISSNSQDWGALGSYIGGMISPAASLLAGYLVYKSFTSNAYQQKLILVRESLGRLDTEIERKLNTPFNNDSLGREHYGKPLREIIVLLSNNAAEPSEKNTEMVLALLHNAAITISSVRYYIDLLNKLPTEENDSQWLGELERAYWIEKYSAVLSRMIRIVGHQTFETRIGDNHFESFKKIFPMGRQ
jgi:hypothetical protein